jgi:hypothetical protein
MALQANVELTMGDVQRHILDIHNRIGRLEGWIEANIKLRHDGDAVIIDNPPQPQPKGRKNKNVIPFPGRA